MNDSLGDRMKGYEAASRFKLTPSLPVIIRVDGKAFHTLTRNYDKPFDLGLEVRMSRTAEKLCEEIDGAVFAYRQSDEISVLVRSDQTLQTSPWFGNVLQKMCSVSASVAAVTFSQLSGETAYFDSRVFTVPPADVVNYFIWRQQDATRNSIQMLARSLYSHRECDNKSGPELQEMCFKKGHNWNDLPVSRKRGTCVYRVTREGETPAGPQAGQTCERSKFEADLKPPIFTAERDYVGRWLSQTSTKMGVSDVGTVS